MVGAHAGDVADVIADVVGDGRGVARVVLGDAGDHFAGEIRADVRSLGVDPAAHAAEHGDGGAAEAEAGDALEELHGFAAYVERAEVDAHQEVHDEQAEPGEREAHDGASSERRVERLLPRERLGRERRGHRAPRVGEDGDHHADVARHHGRDPAHHERKRGEDADLEVPAVLHARDEEDHAEPEDGQEHQAHAVLRGEERLGAVLDVAVNLAQFLVRIRLSAGLIRAFHAAKQRLVVLAGLAEQGNLGHLSSGS
jgi:hypothetical protein